MSEQTPEVTEVWAQLLLCAADVERLRDFLAIQCGLKRGYVARRMHITVFHARRPMPGITPSSEPTNVVLPAADTRFMVMAPGGENPRPELDPMRRTVGIRVHKQSLARV